MPVNDKKRRPWSAPYTPEEQCLRVKALRKLNPNLPETPSRRARFQLSYIDTEAKDILHALIEPDTRLWRAEHLLDYVRTVMEDGYDIRAFQVREQDAIAMVSALKAIDRFHGDRPYIETIDAACLYFEDERGRMTRKRVTLPHGCPPPAYLLED